MDKELEEVEVDESEETLETSEQDDTQTLETDDTDAETSETDDTDAETSQDDLLAKFGLDDKYSSPEEALASLKHGEATITQTKQENRELRRILAEQRVDRPDGLTDEEREDLRDAHRQGRQAGLASSEDVARLRDEHNLTEYRAGVERVANDIDRFEGLQDLAEFVRQNPGDLTNGIPFEHFRGNNAIWNRMLDLNSDLRISGGKTMKVLYDMAKRDMKTAGPANSQEKKALASTASKGLRKSGAAKSEWQRLCNEGSVDEIEAYAKKHPEVVRN